MLIDPDISALRRSPCSTSVLRQLVVLVKEPKPGADRVSSSGILTAVNSIEEWWTSGERVPIRLDGIERAIFLRRMGSGPTMTMLHGYPSSSHDWAKVAPALAQRHSLLLPDFLGFGASEKPADHVYSLHEQADLIEALWALEEITSTIIVAYDYGLSVTQELLARRAEGALSVDIRAVHLLNGGLYPDLARPSRGQLAILDPERGPQISAGITEERFVTALKPTFAAAFDAAADSADIWRATAHQDGRAITHLLTRYIADRAPRRAVGHRPGANRCAGRFRVGHARSGIGRSHGSADTRTPAHRAIPGATGRRSLAAARSARAGRRGVARYLLESEESERRSRTLEPGQAVRTTALTVPTRGDSTAATPPRLSQTERFGGRLRALEGRANRSGKPITAVSGRLEGRYSQAGLWADLLPIRDLWRDHLGPSESGGRP
jgi:pimeloyl-ACP methyl ester carboxylesterase